MARNKHKCSRQWFSVVVQAVTNIMWNLDINYWLKKQVALVINIIIKNIIIIKLNKFIKKF